MKTIILIIIMVGVFYIIDKQSDKNNVAWESYTIEQLKKCDAISKQADTDFSGDIRAYRLNCKNNESIVIDKEIYNLQSVTDITPEESKEQKIIRLGFAVAVMFGVLAGVLVLYRVFREW